MAAAGPATPPAGFLDFCARNPQDCGLQAEAASVEVKAPVVATEAPAAGPTPARHGFDWSTAFAAPHQDRPGGQVATLRQELYSKYMWQAAFAAAHPQAAAPVEAAPAATASEPVQVADNTTAPALVAAEPAASPFVAVQPYLIKASYVSLAEPGPWNELRSDGVVAAPSAPVFEAAPAVTEEAHSEPAVAVTPPAHQPLVMSKSLMAELVAVDRKVNGKIVQTDDVRLYGQDDYWATPIEAAASPKVLVRGDCEDYVLEKRRALIAAGIPADAMSIALADTRFGSHAVLLVDTDQGQLVLDSLNRKVVAWNRTGYRWIKRQAWGEPMSWVEISQAD